MKTRLARDIDTGMSYYIDIDTGEPVEYHQKGEGIMSSLISVGKKITSKFTESATDKAKKAAKKELKRKIASKFEGNDEYTTQQTAKKTIQLVNDKLNKKTDKVVKPKKYTESENKGDVIISLLQSHPDNKKFQPEKTEKTEEQLKNQLLSLEFDKLTEM